MILLDENFQEGQRELMQSWRIHAQQIGLGVGHDGMKDEAIIPLLHQLRHPTFFTLDDDFNERRLCHRNYCIVYLDVAPREAALFVRRVLRHPQFNTEGKRMGNVVRASHIGLIAWQLHQAQPFEVAWNNTRR